MHDATPPAPHVALRTRCARSLRAALPALSALAAVLAISPAAHAQNADADRFAAQPGPRPTPATGLAAGPATLPPPPPDAEQLVLVTSPALPPPRLLYPRAVFGFTAGVGLRSPEAVSAGLADGPAWSVMAGIQLLPWVELDARYFGFYLDRTVGSADQRWLTNAGAGVVRFMVPTPYVQPFVFAGVGGYVASFTAAHSYGFSDQQAITRSVFLGIPVGAGFDILITHRFVLGLELVWHPLVGLHNTDTTTSAPTNMVTGSVAFRFIL